MKPEWKFCRSCGATVDDGVEENKPNSIPSSEKGISVDSIVCPQCGSTDIRMANESLGVCNSCSAQFAVHLKNPPKAEIHIHSDSDSKSAVYSCAKGQVASIFSKDEFLSKAWIELAKEGAPVELFYQDFEEPVAKEHQVLIDSLSVDLRYQASIGYNHEEPYTYYESYTETEPYYDSSGNKQWRSVTKQRPVTKYRTVTAWNAMQGNHKADSIAVVENGTGLSLDTGRLMSSLASRKPDVAEIDIEKLEIDDQTSKAVLEKHNSNLDWDLRRSLPGDEHKDVSYQISSISKHEQILFSCEEYETSIKYKGTVYKKTAFPFGEMIIAGDQIKTEGNLSAVISQKKASIPDLIWSETKKVSIITTILLALSITLSFISFFVHNMLMLAIPFGIAFCAFFYNLFVDNKAQNKITNEVNSDISNYSSYYNEMLLQALNNKLRKLGCAPVSADDLKGKVQS